jgi:hypothetical protein
MSTESAAKGSTSRRGMLKSTSIAATTPPSHGRQGFHRRGAGPRLELFTTRESESSPGSATGSMRASETNPAHDHRQFRAVYVRLWTTPGSNRPCGQ